MTREEALKHAKREQEAYHRKAQDRPFYKDAAEFWDIVVNALEKQDKYKRHDLRKNPEDLPRMVTDEDSETVIVVDSLGEYHSAYWWNYANDWMSVDSGLIDDIIAWRYIEPFEEDNE